MMRRALLLLVILVFAFSAVARVGGGDSYSGGGSSSGGGSGGSGDGDGELIWLVFRFLLWLTIEHPVIGIPVDILVIIAFIRWKRASRGKKNVSVVSVSTDSSARAEARLDGLRRFDPNFSEITFADFCYSLFARAHHARGIGDLNRYTLYLSDPARRALESQNARGLTEVRGVVIGAFRIAGISGLETPHVTVTVEYEANFTEIAADGETSWYVREQWVLERQRDILSPPPEKSKADHCPRCGAALQTRTDGACEYCGVKIGSGAFHWFVREIPSLSRESRGPLLTSTVPEQGTSNPTIYQPHFADAKAAFEAAHPEFRWDEFTARVKAIAVELQDAWTTRDWERVRPLETESLFQMHRYWIDAYKRQGLRNVVGDFAVTRIEPVQIDTDAFYEAITVRIYAHGNDYTANENGKIVAGSMINTRRWTEYWTLIRTRGGATSTVIQCPNCGASVDAGATAICPYCQGKISAGVFDWVLSRIEQDDSYG
jgi:Tim44-like domain